MWESSESERNGTKSVLHFWPISVLFLFLSLLNLYPLKNNNGAHTRKINQPLLCTKHVNPDVECFSTAGCKRDSEPDDVTYADVRVKQGAQPRKRTGRVRLNAIHEYILINITQNLTFKYLEVHQDQTNCNICNPSFNPLWSRSLHKQLYSDHTLHTYYHTYYIV